MGGSRAGGDQGGYFARADRDHQAPQGYERSGRGRRDCHRTGPRDLRARIVASTTFARSLHQFGRRALVDLVALIGNYAGTAALLTAFDMRLDPDQPPPLPPL